MVKQKVVVGVFGHAEFKSGLYFGLALLLHKVLATFQSKHMTVFRGFSVNARFLGKTRQSDFPEYTPLGSCSFGQSACLRFESVEGPGSKSCCHLLTTGPQSHRCASTCLKTESKTGAVIAALHLRRYNFTARSSGQQSDMPCNFLIKITIIPTMA